MHIFSINPVFDDKDLVLLCISALLAVMMIVLVLSQMRPSPPLRYIQSADSNTSRNKDTDELVILEIRVDCTSKFEMVHRTD